MKRDYILALDQGTTSSRALLFDRRGGVVGRAQREIRQWFPQPGWVEHDAVEIWQSQLAVAREVLAAQQIGPERVAAIGIANQRETTIVWERQTGRPISRAIVWQCRRTAPDCDALVKRGWAEPIRAKTGLVIDAYFSGTKLRWLLDHVSGARKAAKRGDLLFGTVDSWLTWKLSGGRVHATDPGNASRTMLYNIHDGCWDDEILAELEIPRSMLPEVVPSSGIVGETLVDLFEGVPIPLAGLAGDQQAALFGQGCFEAGETKNTYGTGCFLLMQTGQQPMESRNGLLTTVAWDIGRGLEYALEGSVFTGGAVIQWLRDEMQLIASAAESEACARRVPDTQGVYIVPAFTGLGAPHWDMRARGTITGITRGAGRDHLVRAALEAIAYQSHELLQAMQEDSGTVPQYLQVDGGAAANNFLMQFQSDILGIPLRRPAVLETTAFGAAGLAGLATGFWADLAELKEIRQAGREFRPAMSSIRRTELCAGWRKAVQQSRSY